MALDQQRNWTVSMEKNFEKIMRSSGGGGTPQNAVEKKQTESNISRLSTRAEERAVWNTIPVYLPDEIILQILEYVSRF